MKARLNNQIVISRHSLGMPVHAGEQGMAGAVRLALGQALAFVDSVLRDAAAMPANDALRGAHWNRAYLCANQYTQPIRVTQV